MKKSLISFARGRLRARRAARYDADQNSQAEAAYASIIAARPDRKLSEDLRQEISLYAEKHFGSKVYAPWLYTYAAWRGEFIEGCIPDNYCGRYVVPHSVGVHQSLLNQTFQRRILETDRIPDVAYIVRGRLFGLGGEALDVAAFSRQMFDAHPYLYLKLPIGRQGQGVKRVTGQTLPDAIATIDEATLQSPVESHPDLEAVFPGAAATIRVTTVHKDGEVFPVASNARFGTGKDELTQGPTNVRATIDLSTGRMIGPAAKADWTPINAHPDTGIELPGRAIPGFKAALEMCVDHHKRIRQIAYVGWDVGITPEEEPMLFEGNAGHAGIKFTEAAVGPIFKGLGWDQLHLKERR